MRARRRVLLASLLALTSARGPTTATGGALTLTVDPHTGAYAFGGTIALAGGATSLRADGRLLSTADGSLALDNAPAALQGTDAALGPYTGFEMTYNSRLMVARIKAFAAQRFVFEQHFPRGVNGTAAHPGGNATEDSYALSSAFPALVLPPAPWAPGASRAAPDLAAACFSGGWLDPLPDWPMISQAWRFNNESADLAAALGFMASVVAIYDGALDVLALAPLDNFLTTHAAVGALGAPGLALGVGVSARVGAIPAGFTSRTIVQGGAGINDTVFALGSALLAVSGKPRLAAAEVTDIGTKYISYWTDNGAFYYYRPESNATYQQTMIDAVAAVKAQGVPVQTLQFDSWWYYRDKESGGVTAWEPMSSIFPSGMDPAWVPLPLVLHNRFFAFPNSYSLNYSFAADGPISVPVDVNLFYHIMGLALKWGMRMYEQDWLITAFRSIRSLQNDVGVADAWLDAMGTAAANLGVTIQYCMCLPRFLLKSTQVPAVTNARASIDYRPGGPNWRIGFSSTLIWALGLQPSKDTLWSTSDQPGCPYTTCREPNVVLQVLVATLSTGPVSPGDKIGLANASLLMASYRAGDGLLLQPDRAATIMDAVYAMALAAAPPTAATLPLQELTHTWSAHGPARAYRWHYILAANLSADVDLNVADLGPESGPAGYAVFDYFALRGGGAGAPLNATRPLRIPRGTALPDAPADALPLRYFVAAPILRSGWVLVGEAAKFVTMAGARMRNFAEADAGFSVDVAALGAEDIDVLVVPPGRAQPVAVACGTTAAQPVRTLTCSGAACACA